MRREEPETVCAERGNVKASFCGEHEASPMETRRRKAEPFEHILQLTTFSQQRKTQFTVAGDDACHQLS